MTVQSLPEGCLTSHVSIPPASFRDKGNSYIQETETMGKRIEIEPGTRFGKWKFLADSGQKDKGNHRVFLMQCDCGKQVLVSFGNLRSGKSTRCSYCNGKDVGYQPKHGYARRSGRSYLYKTWASMVQRCTNPNEDAYANYGGRGIHVHAPWRESFANFAMYILSTLGERPEGCTLDRRDNDKGYIPGNIRWATVTEQASNKRPSINTHWIDFSGSRIPLKDFSRLLGVYPNAVIHHLEHGKSVEWIAQHFGYLSRLDMAA
jgi:uncharacterized protein (DUF433 family)